MPIYPPEDPLTVRDIPRTLRRRWFVTLVSSALFFGAYLAVTRVKEPPRVRARARISLSPPPLLVTAHSAGWLPAHELDPRVWTALLDGRKIRDAAGAGPEAVAVLPDAAPNYLWIEAAAPSADAAAALANAVASAAEAESRALAALQLDQARAAAAKSVDGETARLLDLEARISAIREEVRRRFLCDSLELEARKLQEEIVAQESRRRDLDRRASANRLRLERIRQDRSTLEHLEREAVPRVASARIRSTEHPEIQSIEEHLESLRRSLSAARRSRPEEDPSITALRGEIRKTELDLARAESSALARDLAAEELALRTDSELVRVEIAAVDPGLRDLRDRASVLGPILGDLQRKEREIADGRARLAPLQDARARLGEGAISAGAVQIHDRAEAAEARAVETRLRTSWPAALLAALVGGLAVAFLRDSFDHALRTPFDVRRHLNYPVLTAVPKASAADLLSLQPGRPGAVSELFDTLATVLLTAPSPEPSRVFLVTSSNPREGKTSLSINLAVALARQGKRTLLVDGDLRIPAVHTALGLQNPTGLSDFLAGLVDLATEGVLQEIQVPSLRVMTSGLTPENPFELLDPARLGPVVALLRQQFDAIVLDSPPLLRTGDALKLSTVADGTLFVVKAGATDARQATWAKKLLASVNARIAGVILNGAAAGAGEYYAYDPAYGPDHAVRPF